MKIYYDNSTLQENYAKVKEVVEFTDKRLALVSKKFYQKYFEQFDCEKWTHSETGQRCYNLTFKNYSRFTDSQHIDRKTIKSANRVWTPLITLEKREGITLGDAMVIQNECERQGIEFRGVTLNYGCGNDDLPDWMNLSMLCKLIHNSLGKVEISVGGSLFLHSSFLNAIPEEVTEIRIGEAILCGSIPYSEERIGKNPFALEFDVIFDFGDRILIDAGRHNLTMDSHFIGFEIISINSEYAVLLRVGRQAHVGTKLLCTPSYNNLCLIL